MKLLILLTSIATAAAQTSACSSSDGLSIQNQGDTSALRGCTTFTGSIVVSSDTRDTLSFSGVQRVTGDVKVDGATNLTSFSADSLQAIDGTLTLNNLQNINTLSFPRLISVGELILTGLPNLSQLNFDTGLRTATRVSIQNTFLSSLQGLNLSSVSAMTIANNRMLQTASFAVQRIGGSIIIQGNGDKFQIEFPNLLSAQNITIRSAASISIPSLANVTGNLGFYENGFTSLVANNLTGIGQTLAINAHPNLVNISMPLLRTVSGGFQIQNNTKLQSVSFPSLTGIGGAFDFYGPFNNVSIPNLKDCRGGFNLQSSGTVDCQAFQEYRSNNTIKGSYKCVAQVNNPGNLGSDPGSSNSTRRGAAPSLMSSTGYILATTGLLAGFVCWM